MKQKNVFVVIAFFLLIIRGDALLYNQVPFTIGNDAIFQHFVPFQIGHSPFNILPTILGTFQIEQLNTPRCPTNLLFPGKVIKGDCYYINPTPGSLLQYASFCSFSGSEVFSPFPTESLALFTAITEAFPSVFSSLPTNANFWLGLLQSHPEAPFAYIEDSSVSVDPTIPIFNHSEADVFNGVVLVPPTNQWKVVPLAIPGPHLDNYFICKVKAVQSHTLALKLK